MDWGIKHVIQFIQYMGTSLIFKHYKIKKQQKNNFIAGLSNTQRDDLLSSMVTVTKII